MSNHFLHKSNYQRPFQQKQKDTNTKYHRNKRCPTNSTTNPIIKDISSDYSTSQKNQIVVLKLFLGCQQILAIFDIRYLDVGTSRALQIVESCTPGLENME